MNEAGNQVENVVMGAGGRVNDARGHRGIRIWVLVQGRFRRFARLRAVMDTLEWLIGPEVEAFVYPEGKLSEAKGLEM